MYCILCYIIFLARNLGPYICKHLRLIYGTIQYNGERKVGTNALYRCYEGYTLIGVNDTRKCRSKGHISAWTGPAPFCRLSCKKH